MNKKPTISDIKRILTLSEIAQGKVKFNNNGTKVINPMQQAAANRLYTKAYNLAKEIGVDIEPIHKEILRNG